MNRLGPDAGVPILLIDNFDSFTYNLAQLFAVAGASVTVVRNDIVDVAAPDFQDAVGVIVSPGPGRPEDAGRTCDVIASAAGRIPLFGVCLGHQAIAHTHGATIGTAPSILHGKVSAVTHESEGVFEGIPSPVTVTRYHSLAMVDDYPDTLKVTAIDSNDGTVMALEATDRLQWGVQFHPESILTEHGEHMAKNVLTWMQFHQD